MKYSHAAYSAPFLASFRLGTDRGRELGTRAHSFKKTEVNSTIRSVAFSSCRESHKHVKKCKKSIMSDSEFQSHGPHKVPCALGLAASCAQKYRHRPSKGHFAENHSISLNSTHSAVGPPLTFLPTKSLPELASFHLLTAGRPIVYYCGQDINWAL